MKIGEACYHLRISARSTLSCFALLIFLDMVGCAHRDARLHTTDVIAAGWVVTGAILDLRPHEPLHMGFCASLSILPCSDW